MKENDTYRLITPGSLGYSWLDWNRLYTLGDGSGRNFTRINENCFRAVGLVTGCILVLKTSNQSCALVNAATPNQVIEAMEKLGPTFYRSLNHAEVYLGNSPNVSNIDYLTVLFLRGIFDWKYKYNYIYETEEVSVKI
jgi:hypothetical protein